MNHYIVCKKKRGEPRIPLEVCEKKCELRDECKDFLAVKENDKQIKELEDLKEL